IALTTIFIISISFSYSQTKDSLIAPWWVEKFKLTAGLFVPVNNTRVQVTANGSVAGTDIDFQKDLGFGESQATFLANFQWRISRRSRISLTYYNMKRSSTHKLEKDITFNDQTYHVDNVVNTFFNTAIYQFSYSYAIIEKPRYEAGVMIGAHTLGSKAGISLNGSASGTTSNNFGFTAPLPDLGIWGGYAFSNRFAVNLDFDYLALTINNINGRLIAYDIAFTYKLIRQLDLSLAYTGLNFNVKTSKKNVTGDFRWGYNGPSLAFTFSFGERSWKH
ncbi:MAG TPA: hypothetical protein VK622_17015, partial [Puia sp.]|nr:hypothetical protein [Puia sp.]